MTHQPRRHRHTPPTVTPPDPLRVVPGPADTLGHAPHPGARHGGGALALATGHARHPGRLMLIVTLALLAAMAWRMVDAEPAAARLSVDTVFEEVADNPVEAMAGQPIDDPAYDRATRCVKQPTKGARALVAWLPEISPRGVNWGINRCERWGKHSASLHAEGRAVDWHLDVKSSADRAEAERVIRLLLAPDSDGNPHALARRLGVQGLIWNCQAWWGGDTLVRYSPCNGKDGKLNPRVNPTIAHRDHIHLELNKSAARLQTSWWTDGPGRAAARSVR